MGTSRLAVSEFTALINSNLFPDSLNQTQDVKAFFFPTYLMGLMR